MSDDESKEPVGKMPDGMVRKRRKVRRKRRSKESSASANKVFAKGKDILFGMQKNDDEGHMDVAEQLRRLKRDADDDKPLDDVWGTKRRSSSWLWILLLGIIMPLIIIGIIISKLTNKTEEGSDFSLGKDIGIKKTIFSASDGPMGWFLGSSDEVTADVLRVFKGLNDAKSLEEVMGNIRESPYRRLNPISLEQLSNPFIAVTISDLSLTPGISRSGDVNDTEERGLLIVKGKHADGKKFTAYFVEEEIDGDRKTVLDWDATVGWGEMGLSELVQSKPRKETLIRCNLSKKPIHDLEFGEDQYSGYILSDPENGDFTFAFVPLSSDRNQTLDRQLRRILDYGVGIRTIPVKENVPVTLRVRFGDDKGGGKVFEIVNLEHETWVRP